MKKIITLSMTIILGLTMVACGNIPETEQVSVQIHTDVSRPDKPENIQTENPVSSAEPEITAPQSIRLVGPWRLDSNKNDLAAFADSLELFPGYGEWGAGMEIRSDGRMSWFIGAEGWHGTYTIDGAALHAQLTSDLEQCEQLWELRIILENETVVLEMAYNDMTIYWVYGDQEDSANGEEE